MKKDISHLLSDEHTHEIGNGYRAFNEPKFDKKTYQDVIIFDLLLRLNCGKETFIDSEMVFDLFSKTDKVITIRMLKRSINRRMQEEYNNLTFVDTVFWEHTICRELKFIPEVDEYIKSLLITYQDKNISGITNKQNLSYENYFKNPEYIIEFEKALKDAGVLINGKFNKVTEEHCILEINIITLVLFHKDYLNKEVKASHRIFFGNRFGLAYNEKTYRNGAHEYSVDIPTHKRIYDQYFKIIPTLI